MRGPRAGQLTAAGYCNCARSRFSFVSGALQPSLSAVPLFVPSFPFVSNSGRFPLRMSAPVGVNSVELLRRRRCFLNAYDQDRQTPTDEDRLARARRGLGCAACRAFGDRSDYERERAQFQFGPRAREADHRDHAGRRRARQRLRELRAPVSGEPGHRRRCGTHGVRQQPLCPKHGIEEPNRFDTWERVFERPKFADAVVISTPTTCTTRPA